MKLLIIDIIQLCPVSECEENQILNLSCEFCKRENQYGKGDNNSCYSPVGIGYLAKCAAYNKKLSYGLLQSRF